jgi:hypothetical protein
MHYWAGAEPPGLGREPQSAWGLGCGLELRPRVPGHRAGREGREGKGREEGGREGGKEAGGGLGWG